MNRRRLMMPFLLVAALVFLSQPAPRAASPQAPAAAATTQARRPLPPAQAAPAKAAAPTADGARRHPRLEERRASRVALDRRPLVRLPAVAARRRQRGGRPRDAGRQGVPVRRRRHPGDARRRSPSPRTRSGSPSASRRPRRKRRSSRSSASRCRTRSTILNLADGTETKIDKIQRFAFSGERAAWIALKKYGADAPGGGAAPSGRPRAGGAGRRGGAADERPKGTDLVLHELATGSELNVGNVNEFAFDKSGRFLALTIDAADKLGNGVVLHNMETGAVPPLDSGKASYERLAWTEKGDGLAVLKGTEDKRYKDKVYAVVGVHEVRPAEAGEDRLRPGRRQDVPGRDGHQPQPDADVDRGPLGADVRHPQAEEGGREARREGRREADAKPTRRRAARAAGRRHARRREAGPRDLALQGPAAAVRAAGAGGGGQELQLPLASTGWTTRSSSASPTKRVRIRVAGAQGQVRDRHRRPRVRARGQSRRPQLPGRLRHQPADRRAQARAQEGALGEPAVHRRHEVPLLRGRQLLRLRHGDRPVGQHHEDRARPRSSTSRTTTTSSSRRSRRSAGRRTATRCSCRTAGTSGRCRPPAGRPSTSR